MPIERDRILAPRGISRLPTPVGDYDAATKKYVDDNIGGGGAPVGASYLVLGVDGTLTSERVLTAGTNISFVDAGAGSTLTLNASGGSGLTAAQVGARVVCGV